MTNRKPTRFAICDPHPLSRLGLRTWLMGVDEQFKVVAECSASSELFGLKSGSWDVLIMDIDEKAGVPWQVLREYKHPHKIIIYTDLTESVFAEKIYRRGACGFISKRASESELLSAIQKVIAGGKQVSDEIVCKLLLQITDPVSHENLSPRELEVMLDIGEGKTVSEIARKRCLSVKTISTYRIRILEKLQMKNNAQVVEYIFRNKLLQLNAA